MQMAMNQVKEYSEHSEQKTEPFSQTEIQARLNRSRYEELQMLSSTVPLDDLHLPANSHDIRILLRPLAKNRSLSPGQNSLWMMLRTEAAGPDEASHKVLAVRQTHRNICFPVMMQNQQHPGRDLSFDLYFDPQSDNLVILNRSDTPFTLLRLSDKPENLRRVQFDINPGSSKTLAPGTWRASMDAVDLVDFRILERATPSSHSHSSLSAHPQCCTLGHTPEVTGKRQLEDQDGNENDAPEKKRRPTDPDDQKGDEDGVTLILPAKNNLLALNSSEKDKAVVKSTGHALLDLQPGDTLQIPISNGEALVDYSITKMGPIASTSAATVFTAELSDHTDIPNGIVVVKVLKTKHSTTNGNESAAAHHVVRQAHSWLREFRSQSNLNHPSIVRLYGGDARYLSLYMEHVDAKDLTVRGVWRSDSDWFIGSHEDAKTILLDITNALHYMHGKGRIHNDIKPGNILYSPERGAVLCDMGLSSRDKDAPSTGGTPWYIPPEFLGLMQRGAPSDVWALGVTMLYVLRRMQWPDARAHKAHPKHLHWMIAEVNARTPAVSRGMPPTHSRETPAMRMRKWLNEVTVVRNGLDMTDPLERLVHGMLAPNPKDRVSTATILNHIKSLTAKISSDG